MKDLFDIEPEISEQEQKFLEWHGKNPKVYELFKRFTFQAINAGHKHFGGFGIINRIRWQTTVETKGDEFKINNACAAYYSRMFMKDHPQYEGFFRTKKMKDEE